MTLQQKKDRLRIRQEERAKNKAGLGSYIIVGTILIAIFAGITAVRTKSATNEAETARATKTKKVEKVETAVVFNSPWDGGVYQVERYLKDNLKDPDSYESITWYNVITIGTGFRVMHKYRAKNSFGGYAISQKVFTLDSKGSVIGVK